MLESDAIQNGLGIVAAILSLVCVCPYVYGILKGQVRPHIFTWIIFSLLGGIAAAIEYISHAGFGAVLVTSLNAALCMLCMGLAIPYGTRNITRSDVAAFIAALGAIPIWVLAKDPLPAAVIISLIDVMAIYPTYRKSYQAPHEESATTFTLSALSWLCMVLSIQEKSLSVILYPLTAMTTDLGVVLLVLWRRQEKSCG